MPLFRAPVRVACALLLAPLSVAAQDSAATEEPPELESPAPTPSPAVDLTKREGFTATIVGSRKQRDRTTGSAHVLREKQLEQFEHDDVQRVLKQVPGVYVREEDGFGLRPNIGLRGANSDRSSKVTLLEDGVLLAPAPYSAPAAYYFPFTTRMSGIEVFKGPSSIRNGPQTVGGAINMQTARVPASTKGSLDLAGGMYGAGKAHLRLGTGDAHWGVLLEGVRLQSDGFKQLDGGGPTGFGKNEAMLKARLNTDPAGALFHKVELKLGYSDEISHETYLGLSDADFAANPYRRYAASQNDLMESWRTQAVLTYLFNAGDAFELRTDVYRHDQARTWAKFNSLRGGPPLSEVLANDRSGQAEIFYGVLTGRLDSEDPSQSILIGSNGRTFVSQGVQVAGRWETAPFGLTNALDFGIRLHNDSIRRHHTEKGFAMRGGRLLDDGTPERDAVKNLGETTALAMYAQDELGIGDVLVTPGVRVELISSRLVDDLKSETSEHFSPVLIPGIGASWKVGDLFTVLGGVHKGFSPVAPGQPKDVKPEESINTEFGVRHSSRKSVAEVIGFFNHYSNLTGECTFSSGCPDDLLNSQFNAGAVNVYGLEAMAGHEFRLPLDLRLRADVVYTLTMSRFLSSFRSQNPQFGDVEAGDELPYVPVHQGALMLGLAGKSWNLAASTTYVGRMRNEAGQGELKSAQDTDAQLVVDVAGSWSFTRASSAYFKLDNALDSTFVASRRPYGARPAQPRLFMLGFKHDFDG